MNVVDVGGLTHRYGKVVALDGVDMAVPAGSLYALIGPNGSGKSTLMRILVGLLRPTAGQIGVFGRAAGSLTRVERAQIGYVAEGQRLPGWMTLRELERYLAPLYPSWDATLATRLRERFGLRPDRRVGGLSRGEHMKAALLCALASRPRLLLMDEPFTGMDVLTRDDLVRGLLEFAGTAGWSVILASHDLGEIETLADHVGFLHRGRLLASEPMEEFRMRFRHVEVMTRGAAVLPADLPAEWLCADRSGQRVSFIVSDGGPEEYRMREWFPDLVRVTVRPATLREIFTALARAPQRSGWAEVA